MNIARRAWQYNLKDFEILVSKCCNYPFHGSKITRGDIRLYFKTYEKIAWNIWHLIVKTKISPLFGCPQGPQGCQKMGYYPLKSDLEIWCSNIQPKFQKLWNSTKNQSLFMASGGSLNFEVHDPICNSALQPWLPKKAQDWKFMLKICLKTSLSNFLLKD